MNPEPHEPTAEPSSQPGAVPPAVEETDGYRGSPAAYPRYEPSVPFRAQLLFIAALLAFGGGILVSLAAGWPEGIAVSLVLAFVFAAIPFGAGWTTLVADPDRPPENVTTGAMGPGPDQFPEAPAADAGGPPGG